MGSQYSLAAWEIKILHYTLTPPIKNRNITPKLQANICMRRLLSMLVVAHSTLYCAICWHHCRWRRSWGRFIVWSRIRSVGRSINGFCWPTLLWVNLRSASRRVVYRWPLGIWIVHWWWAVHMVVATRWGMIVNRRILISRIISRSLPAGQKPLLNR